MKNIIFFALMTLFSAATVAAQTNPSQNQPLPEEAGKIAAAPDKGFAYPYYLYVPKSFRGSGAQKQTRTILVLPNNTGKISDDLAVHEADVKRRLPQVAALIKNLEVIVLMPVFPRPETDWQIYTHALDRDSLLTDKKAYRRFDLQLIAMIDDAREQLKTERIKTDKHVIMQGFSASGMFTNRFVFLHPTRVKAAAIGSPGGWAIAPTASYKEKTLRYPLGINDFKAVSGKTLDLKNLKKVPLFVFLGDQDTNDSLPFDDGYEAQDKELAFELFGKTPVERWSISQALYQQNGLNATFKLYPGVDHKISKEMRDDLVNFFAKFINDDKLRANTD